MAAKLAWRDLGTWRHRSAFITLTIALSIASISGVRGAAAVARKALQGDSRAWLAGDIGVDTLEPVYEEQARALDALKLSGIRWTLVTMASAMAASDQAADPAFISIKAIDANAYPFYGAVMTNPREKLAEALRDDTVLVSDEVLDRLLVRVGDTIQVAGQAFRIVARIESDPSRFSNDLGLGMRCILSREGFARTAIARSENSVRNRVLLSLPEGMDVNTGARMLEALFPGASLRDYRSGYRQQTEPALGFLSVAAFLALGLGTLGVAISVREHAEQRLPIFAVMKMLGARNSQTAAVFSVQIGIMAGSAFALGVPLGLFVEWSVIELVRRYLVLPRIELADLGLIAGTAGAALITMAPVLMQPISLIALLRPASILRKDVETQSASFDKSSRKAFWVAVGISCAIVATLAHGMLQSWAPAGLLAAAVLAGAGLASWLSAVALRTLRVWTFAERARKTPLVRHAIAGICRPGNRSRMLIAVLATVLALMFTTFEASEAVVRAIFEILPDERNSLYIARFKDSHVDDLRSFLDHQAGVQSVEIITQARLELTQVDDGGAFDLPSLVACEAGLALPSGSGTKVILAADTARQFRARVGSTLVFDARGERIFATVAAIRPFSQAERLWSNIKVDCSSLDRRILFHQAIVRVAPGYIGAVRRAVVEEYPTFAIITPDDVSRTVLAVGRDAMSLARLVSWFVIGAGFSVMSAIVASSRAARSREIAILRTLGTPSRAIRALYTIEFAAIGGLATAIACALTCGLNAVVLSLLFHRVEIAMEWKPVVIAAIVSVVVIILAGWLPTFRLLERKPMDILRGEGPA